LSNVQWVKAALTGRSPPRFDLPSGRAPNWSPMKIVLMGAACLGFWLAAAPSIAQTPGPPKSIQGAPKVPAPATPSPPVPQPPVAGSEEMSHQAMVEEQERRDREEQAERDRDDQA
jgi:hypothetical protein